MPSVRWMLEFKVRFPVQREQRMPWLQFKGRVFVVMRFEVVDEDEGNSG